MRPRPWGRLLRTADYREITDPGPPATASICLAERTCLGTESPVSLFRLPGARRASPSLERRASRSNPFALLADLGTGHATLAPAGRQHAPLRILFCYTTAVMAAENEVS